MTYAITADTLPNFIIEINKMLKWDKTVLVNFVNPENLYINTDEYKNMERWPRESAKDSIDNLKSMMTKNGN